MQWFLLLSVLVPISLQRSIYNTLLNGNSHFTEVTLEKYLYQFERLTRIQQELYDVVVQNDENFVEALERDSPRQPDQLPFLFEGDIVLTNEQMDSIVKDAEDKLVEKRSNTTRKSRTRSERSMTSALSQRWVKFPIPYFLSYGVDVPAIQAGIARWELETCITFKRQNTIPNGNGLQFIHGNGCYSYVGRVGTTAQQISIGAGCNSLGTVTHEIGHALGFFHEQARSDRDDFVNIITANIEPTYLSQFTKQSPRNMMDYGVPYDYGSVMHYDPTSFTSNGRDTITTKDSNFQQTIGQRVEPAFGDVKKINLAYCQDVCPKTLDCLYGGYTDPKDCSKCRCPDGFSGTLCDEAAPSASACGPTNLVATNYTQSISMMGEGNCNYIIKAPAGKKVLFEINTFSFYPETICSGSNYLELKYNEDMSRTGARLCQSFPGEALSESSMIAVLYRGSRGTKFSLNYRFAPQDPPSTATSTTTKAPVITESTTKSPVETPCQIVPGYPMVILHPGANPIPMYAQTITSGEKGGKVVPKEATYRPTIATTPTPTTKTNGNEVYCTPYGDCSAACGGCGTQSRTCTTGVQSRYCNLQPCANKFCCKPFFYTVQGLCIHPQSDADLIKEQTKLTQPHDDHEESSGLSHEANDNNNVKA